MAKLENKRINSLEGISDILPNESSWWKIIEETGEKIARLHHFHYLETPIIEKAELFEKTLGVSNKSKNKLFIFKAGTRTRMALRPDILIPLMRSYLENRLNSFYSPLRLYTYGPVFIKNRKGKKRQFRQFGFQIIGASNPVYDMEVIIAMFDLLSRLRIKNPILKINIAGCKKCRPKFLKKLEDYYKFHKKEVCKNKPKKDAGVIEILNNNRKRVSKFIDEMPSILNNLCDSCETYFQDILELIEDNQINYVSDPLLLSGKEYNDRLVFEIYPEEGYEKPIITGGREDNLSKKIGGPKLGATGAILHIDELIKYLREKEYSINFGKRENKVFFIAVGVRAKKSCLVLMNRFRNQGIVVLESIERKTLKSQLDMARKSDVDLALIYGQKELFENTVMMREFESGCQESVPLEKMVDEVKRRLKKIQQRTN
jgi:histidyl-tRNA synthetase